jgi:hypothetical protein
MPSIVRYLHHRIPYLRPPPWEIEEDRESMVTVGVHVSIAKSIDLAVDRAKEVGCDTFQIFSWNPRGWAYKDLAEEPGKAFREKMKAKTRDHGPPEGLRLGSSTNKCREKEGHRTESPGSMGFHNNSPPD